MACLMAAVVMTPRVLEGHSPIASFFKWDFWYSWLVARSLRIRRASSNLLQPCELVQVIALKLGQLSGDVFSDISLCFVICMNKDRQLLTSQ